MAGPTPHLRAADVLGRVTLVTGKEEFLNERTVAAVRDAVRAHDADAELGETTAADLTLATLGEMAAPSLFSTIRCVVVRGLEKVRVAPAWIEESLELLQTGGEAWNQAERAKIADLNWRIVAEKH